LFWIRRMAISGRSHIEVFTMAILLGRSGDTYFRVGISLLEVYTALEGRRSFRAQVDDTTACQPSPHPSATGRASRPNWALTPLR
jgi:hypothetical protein